MELTNAARFLNPCRFCLAAAATAPALGELGSPAFPILFSLIAAECNMPLSEAHPPNMSFSALTNMFRSIPFKPKLPLIGRLRFSLQIPSEANLTDVLHGILYIAIATPHGVTILIELLNILFTDAPSPASTFEPDGLIFLFLRKIYVAFHSLSFESEARLSHDLRQFIYPQPENVEYSSPTVQLTASLIANIALDLGSGPPWTLGRQTIANDIQKFSFLVAPTSSPPSHMSQTTALHPLPHTPDSTETVTATAGQYAAHLEALRRKDMSTVFDTLHRYFDRSLFFLPQTKRSSFLRPGTTHNNNPVTSMTEPHAHQYAGLALATAHAQLGNLDAATTAFDDALRAAHAADDRVCRSLVLAWIAHTEQEVPRRQLLLVHAGDSLAFARDLLQTVFTPVSDLRPYASLPSLHRSFTIPNINIGSGHLGICNLNESTIATVPTAVVAASTRRLCTILPPFAAYGKNRVQQLLTLAAARFSDADAPTALSNARLASRVASTESPRRVTKSRVQAAIAMASLTSISEGQAEIAEEILLSIRSEANTFSRTAIVDIASNANAEIADRIKLATCVTTGDKYFTAEPEIDAVDRALKWLNLERAERHKDLLTAEILCQQIRAMATVYGGAANTAHDPVDLALDALEATVRFHISRSDAWRAVEAAHTLCRRAAVAVRPTRTIDALRLSAQAHLIVHAGGHALHAVLAAISLSEGLGLSRTRVQCEITLAECLLSNINCDIEDNTGNERSIVMFALHRALRIIEDVLPRATEGLGVFGRAHARRVHAECRVALLSTVWCNEKRKIIPTVTITTADAKQSKTEMEEEGSVGKGEQNFDDEGVGISLQGVVKELMEAATDYKQCEDIAGEKRCWYLLARVHHWRGDSHQRNTAARRFNKLTAFLQYREAGLFSA